MILSVILTFVIVTLANTGLDKFYYKSPKESWAAQAKDAGYSTAIVLTSYAVSCYIVAAF